MIYSSPIAPFQSLRSHTWTRIPWVSDKRATEDDDSNDIAILQSLNLIPGDFSSAVT